MKKVKITVLQRDFRPQLADRYAVEGFGPCPVFQEGQTFEVERGFMPQGFCGEAWLCIEHYVFALAHGATAPIFEGAWVKEPGVAVCTCNDGLRPVTFLIEQMD